MHDELSLSARIKIAGLASIIALSLPSLASPRRRLHGQR